MSNLSYLFEAKSLAVIGASNNPTKYGNIILSNILEGGYKGELYPINPLRKEILGIKCYPSLSSLAGKVELAVVIVKNHLVPEVLEEAGKTGIKAAVVISGGFSEAGQSELQDKVLKVVKKYDIRLLGPNCQGINYTPNKMCASWPVIKQEGKMAVISQSGSIGAELGKQAENEGLGVSAVISLGNKIDVNELDLLEYFDRDKNTSATALYLEAVSNGQAFLQTASRLKKPVVILKPGKTSAGQKAANTHTNSVTGKREVFDGVCKQYGFINADSLEELYDCTKLLSMTKNPQNKRLQIISSSGGGGVLACDAIVESGMQLAAVSEERRRKLRAKYPAHFTVGNPFDLTGDANPELYKEIILELSKEDGIDIFLPIVGDPIEGVAAAFLEARKNIKQDLVVCFFGGAEVQVKETLEMHRNGLPVFPTPERAVNAIAKMFQRKIRP